jgi:hypothetical protein
MSQQMNRELEFREWDDACDSAWEREIPRFKPRIASLAGFTGLTSSQYDLLSIQILEDMNYEDKNRIYLNKRIAHSDEVVQYRVQSTWQKYATSFPRKFPVQKKCPYCMETLRRAKQGNDHDIDDLKIGVLETCPNCNYWLWHYIQGTYIGRWDLMAYFYTVFLGKIREFDTALPVSCKEEIASWIRRNPTRWHSINPISLEKLVADIFRSNYEKAEVTHVGKPDDGGVDVIYIDIEKQQWLIQVKRREKPEYSEPVSTIRNLLGTMVLENASHGIVVSTADHFSYRAYDAINRAKERGMTIELINRRALDQMLTGLLPDRPWLGPIQWIFPEFTSRLLKKIPSKHYRQLKLF